ncbi:MAG: exodeoxyribonuclease VII large subunit [Acidobacteriota bacterium]
MRDPGSNPLSALFAERQVLTVSALTERIRRHLESAFRDLEVQGEVSNFKRHQSGHWYFTLKDSGAQVRAVFFKQFNRLLRFELENGLEVRIRGRVSVYDQRGDYQLLIDTIVPVQTGALQLAFEQMRRRLAAEGLFDTARKRRLPLLPRCVGVVTSLDGAVSRDIVNVLGRRNPSLPIVIAPVHVQGNGACAEIVNAIALLNQGASRIGRHVDVIILARGGGSAEDLWAFNEERVARAIAGSAIPIISAVGHETDITIADLVADLRAATPSVAAEMVAPAADDLRSRVNAEEAALRRLLEHLLVRRRAQLGYLLSSRGFANAETRMRSLASLWSEMESRAARAFQRRLDFAQTRLRDASRGLGATDLKRPVTINRTRVTTLELTLLRGIELLLARGRSDLALNAGQLDMLSPLKVLGRGYLLAQRASGGLVTQACELVTGDLLKLRFADGDVGCEVTETKER